MSFMSYLKEQEELDMLTSSVDKMGKVTDFIRTMDSLNNEQFKSFAKDELGLTDLEAETIVYKMLKDFVQNNDTVGNVSTDISTDVIDISDADGIGLDLPSVDITADGADFPFDDTDVEFDDVGDFENDEDDEDDEDDDTITNGKV